MPRLLTAALTASLLLACHAEADDVAPDGDRRAQATSERPEAKRITIDGSGLAREQIEEVARHVEGLGAVAQARVKVRQDPAGNSEVLIEIVGTDLPTDAELTEEIRSLSGMGEAAIAVEAMPEGELAEAAPPDASKSPEEVKAEVVERLRAEGVEGDVQVDVVDEDGQRRVEVRVENHGGPAAGTPGTLRD